MTQYRDNMTATESAALVAECDNLDTVYAAASRHDQRKHDEWIKANFVALTRRTERPKLGYIIHALNEAGIPCIEYGESRDAPILRVAMEREADAWAILDGNYHGRTLDSVSDNAPSFRAYAQEQCAPLDDN